MEILGYFGAVLIGVSLGLIGGGGSILTVPLLVYVFNVDVVTATAYSLFIVGASSLVGSIKFYVKKLIDLKTALVFGAPAIVAVFLTRAFLIPAIPDHIMNLFGLNITKGVLLMVLFAILMIVASVKMIQTKSTRRMIERANENRSFNYPLIIIEGLLVGALTGLVGAGGGFLIIPALVILSNLPMKKAIGTSLLIIALKSLIGFMGESSETEIRWGFLIIITLLAIGGIFLGSMFALRIDGKKLKPAFGWFVLGMGILILVKEIFLF